MQRFLFIFLAYVLALGVAAIVYFAIDAPLLWRILWADVAATVVVFGFSVWFKNSSFYDAYWSVAPIIMALTLLVAAEGGNLTRELMVLALVSLWGIRLTWNWGYGWSGLDHEDWRYGRLQEQTGIFYWLVSFLGIHMFPTIIVFVGCIPLFPVFDTDTPLNLWDALAALITLSAIALEAEADRELHRFRATRRSSREILQSGVWAWCRHPNYLGELGFWFGLFLFGCGALNGESTDLMKLGPISMLLLFVIISIPMIDTKLVESKPGYEELKKRSFALIPLSFLRSLF